MLKVGKKFRKLKHLGAGQELRIRTQNSWHHERNHCISSPRVNDYGFKFKNIINAYFRLRVVVVLSLRLLSSVWALFDSLFPVESSLYHGGNRYGSD
jgi:hypothetical protein